MKNYRKNLGQWGERLAIRYLEKIGYRILEKNWRVKEGEVDIIALDKRRFVFIEVKTRKNNTFGYPAESITNQKQTKMIKCIKKYLEQHHTIQHYDVRLDIILISLDQKKRKIKLEHLKNPVENCPDY